MAPFDLQSWQRTFAHGLQSGHQKAPSGLFEGPQKRQNAGWQIYLNNVTHSLTSALGDTFPVCKALVGNEFFALAARTFLLEAMPTSPVLLEYGDSFASFLARFEPAASLPCLADVARLEFAWLQSYHARDVSIRSQDLMSPKSPETISASGLGLHPSLFLLRSDFPVCEIWHAHQDAGARLGHINMSKAQCALILRHHDTVHLISISQAMTTFIKALEDNHTLAEAAGMAQASGEAFSLESAFNLLLKYDAVIRVDTAATTPRSEMFQ
jgi:hypothetical protein